MKTLLQTFRQPIKTTFGILLVALAVAILVTCVGQYAATNLVRANVDDRYNTVAMLSDAYFWEGSTYYIKLPEQFQSWIDETVQQRADIIQKESFSQLYSAYIPGVSPDNFSQYENGDWMDTHQSNVGYGTPYRCAMLEVTLTAIGTVVNKESTFVMGGSNGVLDGQWQEIVTKSNILCVGMVERVVGLEQGFSSPVGKTIAMIVQTHAEEDLAAMDLQVGQRYLVFGMDYSNVRGDRLKNSIGAYKEAYEELFGAAQMGLNGPEYGPILDQIDCFMTVCDYASLPAIFHDQGSFSVRPDLRRYTYKEDNVIKMQFIDAQTFMADYCVPSIVKLDGTAEDYLHTDAGSLWQKALDEMQISNHGFPVLAVDKLGYQLAFARGDARIVQGRDFTEKERTTGAKVCVISENLALQNGLSIGDSICMQTYGFDPNIAVQSGILTSGSCFPDAAVYSATLGFTSEPEEYTIVGFYRQNNAWQNRDDVYGFTPNVIFVPMGSISGDYKVGSKGIYYTLVLQNGKMEEFRALQAEAGYPNLFICLDQGYTEIVESLDAYEGVSAKALYVGVAACAVIMALFLILFPLQQRKTMATMTSLGTNRGMRVWYTVCSAMLLLLPGMVIGSVVGVLAWEKVTASLMKTVNVQIPLELDMMALVPALSLVLLAVMAVTILLLALTISGNKGLMKRT